MIFSNNNLRKVVIDFEETPPPKPPTPPTPPPVGDQPWDEPPRVEGDGDREGEPGGSDPIILPPEQSPEKSWREDTDRERQRSAGSIPGALKEILEEMYAKKVIDWKILLRRYINKMSSKTDYFLPNKRFLGTGSVLWGSKKRKEGFDSMIIIVDTSGSIGRNELQQFISETLSIMKDFKPKETYLIWCDAAIYPPIDVLKSTNDIWKMREPRGGGGTSFVPPFKWIEENLVGKKKIGPTVYFTDGYGDFPDRRKYGLEKYAKNVFWAIVSHKRPNDHIEVPFGTKIDLVIE